jgi:hypothetical protein
MHSRLLRVLPLLAVAGMLSGCAARMSVAELKYNPARYHDKTVALDGVVTSSWGVPLVPFQFYKIDDGTGELTVISQNGRNSPPKGAHVRVTGRVGDMANFGGRSVGLHLREKDLDFKGSR